MELIETDYLTFKNILPDPFHIFGSADFNEINKDKCEGVFYFLFKDSKYRLGLIAGLRNKELISPFSAPFGGFSFLQEDVKINYIDDALILLQEWAKTKEITKITITLPPAIYQESYIAKQLNSLFRNQFQITVIDLNYAYSLNQFSTDYPASIWYNARKNLKIAMSHDFTFQICETTEENELAYNIIQQNRTARGFPLRMTWAQVKQTSTLLQADFFLVTNKEGANIAAAVVFHVSPGIVQVIYWGDLPEFAALKTMNFLSYKIFEHYHNLKLNIIDIGPSTENSLPNFGLCEFKESIGCSISSKFSFVKEIN